MVSEIKVNMAVEVGDVLTKKVSKQGEVGVVYLPKEWIGREVFVVFDRIKMDSKGGQT